MKKRILSIALALVMMAVISSAVQPAVAVNAGDIIQFGDHDWRVLYTDTANNRKLIITENVIEERRYHGTFTAITWENSEIRQHLNNTFLDSFNETDRARIRQTTVINDDNPWTFPEWTRHHNRTPGGANTTDHIFLLSLEELVRYFGDSGMLARGRDLANRSVCCCEGGLQWPERGIYQWGFHDQFSESRIAISEEWGTAWCWWLRSPGYNSDHAARVFDDGSVDVDGNDVDNGDGGVRPALWLSIEQTDPLSTASEWAHQGITSAISRGFVPERIQGDYQNVITREEFSAMAVRWVEYTLGRSADAILTERNLSRFPNPFTDTSNNDILAAYALGITSGVGEGRFDPQGNFTREQAATMIMNTLRVIDPNAQVPVASTFADINTAASEWARPGISFVQANGIMSGTGDNNFSPHRTFTRQESIVTFDNIEM